MGAITVKLSIQRGAKKEHHRYIFTTCRGTWKAWEGRGEGEESPLKGIWF